MPLLRKRYATKPIRGRELKNTINYLRHNPQFRNWNYDFTPVLDKLERQSEITLPKLIETLYSSFAESEGKTIWADKSLFFRRIELLGEIFPTARFIHLVRDGRDVFHSWRKMDPTKDNVAAAAMDWNYKLARINRAFASLPDHRHITIRYEDLIEHPEDTVHSLCSFLEIPFESSMMDYHHTSKYYIGKHHSELIFKSIDSTNRDKWRHNLSDEEIRIYELLSRQNILNHGYQLSGKRFRAKDAARLASILITGIPKRAYQVVSRQLAANRALKHGIADQTDVGEAPENRHHEGNS